MHRNWENTTCDFTIHVLVEFTDRSTHDFPRYACSSSFRNWAMFTTPRNHASFFIRRTPTRQRRLCRPRLGGWRWTTYSDCVYPALQKTNRYSFFLTEHEIALPRRQPTTHNALRAFFSCDGGPQLPLHFIASTTFSLSTSPKRFHLLQTRSLVNCESITPSNPPCIRSRSRRTQPSLHRTRGYSLRIRSPFLSCDSASEQTT